MSVIIITIFIILLLILFYQQLPERGLHQHPKDVEVLTNHLRGEDVHPLCRLKVWRPPGYMTKTEPFIEDFDIIKNGFLDKLTVMVNQKQVTVVLNKYVIYNTNHEPNQDVNVLIFNSDKLKEKKSFCINNTDAIETMLTYLENIKTDRIIITVRSVQFLLLQTILFNRFVEIMKKFGMKKWNFTNYSNYLLIKDNNRIFEDINDNSVSYPELNIAKYMCKKNPDNLYPDKNYIFFNDKVDPQETINRCFLEASSVGKTNFALWKNSCILLDGFGDLNELNKMSDSSNCGEYNNDDLSVYLTELENDHIVGYDAIGTSYDFVEGENEIINIVSINVPKNYYVYLIKNNELVKALYSSTNDLSNYKYDKIVVNKHRPNNVIVSDTENNYFTYHPGTYILPSYFFRKINFVKLSPNTQKLILYNDVSHNNQIQLFDDNNRNDNDFTAVNYPRYVRSITLL